MRSKRTVLVRMPKGYGTAKATHKPGYYPYVLDGAVRYARRDDVVRDDTYRLLRYPAEPWRAFISVTPPDVVRLLFDGLVAFHSVDTEICLVATEVADWEAVVERLTELRRTLT